MLSVIGASIAAARHWQFVVFVPRQVKGNRVRGGRVRSVSAFQNNIQWRQNNGVRLFLLFIVNQKALNVRGESLFCFFFQMFCLLCAGLITFSG